MESVRLVWGRDTRSQRKMRGERRKKETDRERENYLRLHFKMFCSNQWEERQNKWPFKPCGVPLTVT